MDELCKYTDPVYGIPVRPILMNHCSLTYKAIHTSSVSAIPQDYLTYILFKSAGKKILVSWRKSRDRRSVDLMPSHIPFLCLLLGPMNVAIEQ